MTAYAELHCTSNFTFLQGGSHPDELVIAAKALGLSALALTDQNSLAGVVRGHVTAKDHDLPYIPGARIDLADGPGFLVLPTHREAYARLSRMISTGQRRAQKGACHLFFDDLVNHAEGQQIIMLPPDIAAQQDNIANAADQITALKERLAGPLWLAAHHHYRGDDRQRIGFLDRVAARAGVGLVATGDVLYHSRSRRALQDVLSCIREGTTIGEAGHLLTANAERCLKGPAEMARLFIGYEHALTATLEIAQSCQFSLDELRYDYPDEPVPEGRTAQEQLAYLTWCGAEIRFPKGLNEKLRTTIAHELQLIEQLDYAPYFLTVHDIVQYARAHNILCQGRGSAANSIVCFCLFITAVDPTEVDLLFERFISAERNEPPDIDVDFEHERREEVIQYIYARYGRDRAALAATVISYRARSAVREVGKALGLSEDSTAALAGTVWGSYGNGIDDTRVREAGLDPTDIIVRRTLTLSSQLIGFPRHLSQHVGGFVLTQRPLHDLVPISNAAMEARTVIEWDKDDIDALGILKIDVLALGMLTCLRKGFDLLAAHYDRRLGLASVPRGDGATYDMLCRADSVGVFQVESRAQMNMLPRLKPRNFYDLVIEVAIVRPGPIQGDMVHPYLRRRNGDEPVDFPSPAPEYGPPDELKQVLAKTCGVPLFQEQAMRIAIVAAGFTPSEADQLRRAMATFRRVGTIHSFQEKLVDGMTARGYDADFAARCFKQIEGFGEYGFPESHAASFALLVYISAWMKCHFPDVFCCALLNAQPMGFYAPAQIVRDAREHGVTVLPVDINHSNWDNLLENKAIKGYRPVRLGFRQIKGLRQDDMQKLVAARLHGAFVDMQELHRRTGLRRPVLEKLAQADCFRSIGQDRRAALWAVKALPADPVALPLFHAAQSSDMGTDDGGDLPYMTLPEHVVEDYQTLRLSLKAHPLSFLRPHFIQAGLISATQLRTTANGQRVALAGLVLVRQRPGSAKGVVFMTLEDETGVANAVVWPKMMEKYRKEVMGSRLAVIHGRIQRHEDIIHLVADRVEDWSTHLLLLSEAAEDMKAPLARADEVARPIPDRTDHDPAIRRKAGGRPVKTLQQKLDEILHDRGGLKPNLPSRHPRTVRDLVPKSRDFH